MPVALGFHLMSFGLTENAYMTIGTPIQNVSSRNSEEHTKVLSERRLRREIKRLLDTDRPYKAPMGLLEPKPEPVEDMVAPHEFMYRRQGIFDEGSS